MSKKSEYIRKFVIKKLQTDPKWALRALELIAANQTNSEYEAEEVEVINGIGFNGKDAKMLTSFSKFYANRKEFARRHRNDPDNVTLTPNQMVALHKMIFKYWKQVVNASDQFKLEKMVIIAEVAEMNQIAEDKLPLYIHKKWIFDETKLAFLKRLKSEQLVLNLTI